jgi:NTE family protein
MRCKLFIILISIVFLNVLSAQILIECKKRPFLSGILHGDDIEEEGAGRPKIALVLSGGGARGVAHVGVIKALEKYQIPIDLIVGSSIGSVIGGLYAAGYSIEELESLVTDLDWEDLFRDQTERKNLFLAQKKEIDRYILTIRFDGFQAYIPTSIAQGQKVLSLLSRWLQNTNFQAIYNFNNLKIPFRSVSTDLISGSRIVIEKGDLAEAIYASTAVPLLFSPFEWDEMLLVDGGLKANLPVDVARELGMDIIIAVDITSPLESLENLNLPWQVLNQVTTIMMEDARKEQILQADVIIRPDLEGIGNSDFSKVEYIINRGEQTASDKIADIRECINKRIKTVGESIYVKEINYSGLQNPGLLDLREQEIELIFLKKKIREMMESHQYKCIRATYRDSIIYLEAQQYGIFNTVLFRGQTVFTDSTLKKMVMHIPHTQLNYSSIISDMQAVREYYLNRGYSLMNFKTMTFDSSSGILEVEINEGILNKLAIEGNDKTKDYVIYREFPLKPNQIFDAEKVKTGIENIYSTNLFQRVNVNLMQTGDKYDLIIKVKERKYTALHLGGKGDTERGLQSYLDLAHENFAGTGDRVSLLGRIGSKDRGISFNYRADRIFKTYFTLGISLFYQWQSVPLYVGKDKAGRYLDTRQGSKFLFGQQLKRLGQLTVEFDIRNVDIISEVDSAKMSNPPSTSNSEIRSITLRSITDKRDRIAFTREGTYNIWYWETGQEQILGGQEKYTKAYVQLEGYYTKYQKHTFHVKGVVGIADLTLPFSEYFRLGGLDNFMGLHEYQYYGRQLLYTNLEYRYKQSIKSFSDIYFSFRYDLGGIWEKPDLVMDAKDFFYSIGGIIGINTIAGPLKLGYGMLSKGNQVFYLSWGYDF